MNHTKGPWRQGITLMTPTTRKWKSGHIEANDLAESLFVFANFKNDEKDQGRSRILVAKAQTPEDANLIAAAPEMLELLKDCHYVLVSRSLAGGITDETIIKIQNLVTKAEGKSNE